MENPQYLVNIFYEPTHVSGQQLTSLNGVTYSVPTYTSGYFVATMPEVKIFATGSSYTDALTNLLNIATASSTESPGQLPLSNTRTW